MAKYPEGTVSASGKYVVQGGQWVSRETPTDQAAAPSAVGPHGRPMAPEDRRNAEYMAGSKVAASPYEEPSAAGRMLGTGIEAATMAGAGAMMAPAGVAGTVLRFAKPAAGLARDLVVAQGAEELAKASGIPGAPAVAEVLLGGKALLKTRAKDLLLKSVAKWAAERGVAGAAEAALPAAGAAAEAAVPAVAAGAAEATPQAVAAAAKQLGRAVKPDWAKVTEFVKGVGKSAKRGERIWVLLDDAGKPIMRVSPDQAGAAARAGTPTTWMANLWGG